MIIQKIIFLNILCRSQVGHCNSRESFRRQQNLQKAIQEAHKLVKKTPTLGRNEGNSSVTIPNRTTSSLMKLLSDITEETDQGSDQHSKNPVTEGELQGSLFSVTTTTEQLYYSPLFKWLPDFSPTY
jgi:transient-receptor-potential-like protein